MAGTSEGSRKGWETRRRNQEVAQYQDTPGFVQHFGEPVSKVAQDVLDQTMPVPHILTFNSLNRPDRTYPPYDEATWDSRRNAIRMRNDLAIWECVEARQVAVAQLPWHLEPENDKDPKQVELVNTLTKIIERTWRFDEFRRVLQEAIWYGRSACQCGFSWDYVDGQRVMVQDQFAPVNGDKLVFGYDRDQIGIYIGRWTREMDTHLKQRGKSLYPNRDSGEYDYMFVGGRMRQIVNVSGLGQAFFLDQDEQDQMVVHKHQLDDAAHEDHFLSGGIHGVGIRSRIYTPGS